MPVRFLPLMLRYAWEFFVDLRRLRIRFFSGTKWGVTPISRGSELVNWIRSRSFSIAVVFFTLVTLGEWAVVLDGL